MKNYLLISCFLCIPLTQSAPIRIPINQQRPDAYRLQFDKVFSYITKNAQARFKLMTPHRINRRTIADQKLSFDLFFKALEATGAIELLDCLGSYTLLLPTNDALRRRFGIKGIRALFEPRNLDVLTKVVLTHILPDRYLSTQIMRGQPLITVAAQLRTIYPKNLLADSQSLKKLQYELDNLYANPAFISRPVPVETLITLKESTIKCIQNHNPNLFDIMLEPAEPMPVYSDGLLMTDLKKPNVLIQNSTLRHQLQVLPIQPGQEPLLRIVDCMISQPKRVLIQDLQYEDKIVVHVLAFSLIPKLSQEELVRIDLIDLFEKPLTERNKSRIDRRDISGIENENIHSNVYR